MKSNLMIRLIALMILIPIALAHFSGQIDLTQPSWLWLTLFAGINALQASFTGWCPATKFIGNKKSNACCNDGSQCCEPETKDPFKK